MHLGNGKQIIYNLVKVSASLKAYCDHSRTFVIVFVYFLPFLILTPFFVKDSTASPLQVVAESNHGIVLAVEEGRKLSDFFICNSFFANNPERGGKRLFKLAQSVNEPFPVFVMPVNYASEQCAQKNRDKKLTGLFDIHDDSPMFFSFFCGICLFYWILYNVSRRDLRGSFLPRQCLRRCWVVTFPQT